MENEKPNFNSLYYTVGELAGQFRTLNENLQKRMEAQDKRVEEVEKCVSDREKAWARMEGKATAFGIIMGGIGFFLSNLNNISSILKKLF